MKDIEFEIGMKIHIYTEGVSYSCTIQDMYENTMAINLPLGDEGYLTFESGNEIEMTYFDRKGYFVFKVKYIRRFKENNIILYEVTMPYDISRIQRRSHVRVNMLEKFHYRLDETSYSSWLTGDILDLSGGGFKIQVKEKINPSDIIIIKIPYDDKFIEVQGRVIREVFQENINHIYAVSFLNIKEAQRDKIIEKVFSKLREELSRR